MGGGLEAGPSRGQDRSTGGHSAFTGNARGSADCPESGKGCPSPAGLAWQSHPSSPYDNMLVAGRRRLEAEQCLQQCREAGWTGAEKDPFPVGLGWASHDELRARSGSQRCIRADRPHRTQCRATGSPTPLLISCMSNSLWAISSSRRPLLPSHAQAQSSTGHESARGSWQLCKLTSHAAPRQLGLAEPARDESVVQASPGHWSELEPGASATRSTAAG